MRLGKTELIEKIEKGWESFHAYLRTLKPEQLTIPTDTAGWTAKDHLAHLAVWEDGIFAMLNGRSRNEAMNVDATTWATRDFDKINAVIQHDYQGKSLEEVMTFFNDAHSRLFEKVKSMSEDELYQPYNTFTPESPNTDPVINWITGDTYEHYAEHQPWIKAIVDGQDQ